MVRQARTADARDDRIAEILNFTLEVGCLKRVRRSGWWLTGLAAPESVAEHSFRTAIIGLLLAELEGADPYRTAAMCLFHDLNEARLLDSHAVAKKYIHTKAAEDAATRDSLMGLPDTLKIKIEKLLNDFRDSNSKEGVVARDADVLECIIQAAEYRALGVTGALTLATPLASRLQTESGKKIADIALKSDPNKWWENLPQQKGG